MEAHELTKTGEPPKFVLDARIEAEKLSKLYTQDMHQQTFNLLILGETGTGKTRLIETARRPVHIDSFDKGGTKVLKETIDKGADIIVDASYEDEDGDKPRAFEKWRRDFENRRARKYFDALGTYCLDSCSSWSEAIMNWVLLADGRQGEAPKFTRDYVPQKVQINKYLDMILSLPCDVIVTGHLEPEFEMRTTKDGDEERSLIRYKFSTTGKGAIIIPTKFDEIYITQTNQQGAEVNYQLLTSRQRFYWAKTRIGRGKFARLETPDIKALLKRSDGARKTKSVSDQRFKWVEDASYFEVPKRSLSEQQYKEKKQRALAKAQRVMYGILSIEAPLYDPFKREHEKAKDGGESPAYIDFWLGLVYDYVHWYYYGEE